MYAGQFIRILIYLNFKNRTHVGYFINPLLHGSVMYMCLHEAYVRARTLDVMNIVEVVSISTSCKLKP